MPLFQSFTRAPMRTTGSASRFTSSMTLGRDHGVSSSSGRTVHAEPLPEPGQPPLRRLTALRRESLDEPRTIRRPGEHGQLRRQRREVELRQRRAAALLHEEPPASLRQRPHELVLGLGELQPLDVVLARRRSGSGAG